MVISYWIIAGLKKVFCGFMFIFLFFLNNEGFEFEFFNKIFCGMFFDKLIVLFLIIFSGETFLDLFILVLV